MLVMPYTAISAVLAYHEEYKPLIVLVAMSVVWYIIEALYLIINGPTLDKEQ